MKQSNQKPKTAFSSVTADDLKYLDHALSLARAAEKEGNLPIGALITLDGHILAESGNKVLVPDFHPGRHAEIEALNKIPGDYLYKRSKDMTLYTTQEPCVMCLGAIILYRIGRVVYGGSDPKTGATYLIKYLQKIYEKNNIPIFVGPVSPELCDAMFRKADTIYRKYRDISVVT
jgi:tRNA(adenine34) deaminase